MSVPKNTRKAQLEAHLQQWFAELIPSISGTKATRLDALNLTQVARQAGLNQGNLRLFALGQRGLSLASLKKLVTVIEGLGYTLPADEPKL